MDLHGPRDTSKLAYPEPSRGGQLAALLRLAGPVVLARAGNTVPNVTQPQKHRACGARESWRGRAYASVYDEHASR